MKYKAAIIGTGKIAGLFDALYKGGIFTHAKACKKVRDISLEVACDKDMERLDKFCKRWRIKDRYTNVDGLLDNNKLDIILLCTPNHTHFSLIKTILRHANRPRILLVEKPLCLNREELSGIKEMLAGIDTKLIVNHTYRFHPGIQQIKTMIESGELGKMLSVRAIYYGGLLNNGVHVLDTLRMLTGSGFKIVTAKIGAKGRKGDDCIDAELLLRRHHKVKVFLESFDEKYYQLYEIEIKFESGRIRIMDFARQIFIDRVLINRLGEKGLKNVNKITLPGNSSPFLSLFNKILAYLNDNDRSILSEAGVEEAGKTMVYLWKIRDRALKWQN